MGFKYTHICDLLSSLEANRIAKAANASKKDDPDYRTITQWFSRHQRYIHHPDTDRLALFSCMFPEKREDRVYWLGASSLARVIGRCLGLGSSRLSELDRWRTSGGPDLGYCVERVLCQAENYVLPGREVLVEEVDQAMNMIASRCRFSGPKIRRQHRAVDVDAALSHLYRRLSSRDAKWLTRMILKSFSPVVLPQRFTLDQFHFLLPQLLQFQDTFEGALKMLSSEPICHFPPHPDTRLAKSLCALAVEHLRPQTGIKIGRPEYFKARSIRHCVQMAEKRRMSMERKYDGEYCQIHIDLANKRNPIQIFSKSGKDSTNDRRGILETVEDSLQLRLDQCKFKQRCILEGELLVWSDKLNDIVGFHKLRKFLPRSGTFLGIDSDSPPQPYERLMIVFFDVLLVDDDACLRKLHCERRLLLQSIIHRIPGRVEIAEQEVLDFSREGSQHRLEVSFSNAIARRWEGLVLKACDEPYFPIYSHGADDSFGRWIKLKKDYIPGLGDTVDLALIGASYDAQDASAVSTSNRLRWTHFLVGCLLNKNQIDLHGAVPRFRAVDNLNRHSMHRRLVELLNQVGEFSAQSAEGFGEFHVEYGHKSLRKATVYFKKPFVVELMGSGFEKPSDARYFTLRFPRLLKVHMDRTYEDAASFQELQILAEEARSVPQEDFLQEREQWCKRLKTGNGMNSHAIRRSQTPVSTRNSSTASDSDWTEPCRQTSNDNDDLTDLCMPALEPLQDRSDAAGQVQTHRTTRKAPAVHVDGTLSLMQPSGLPRQRNILTENENLSSRHDTDRKGLDAQQLPWDSCKPLVLIQSLASNCSQSASMSANTVTLLSQEYSQKNGEVVLTTHDSHPSSTISKFDNLVSPLTTVPVYTETTLPGFRARVQHSDPDTLVQFLQTMSSMQTLQILRQSNPKAVSQGTVFGIVLVDPAQSSLGPEIHRISKALHESLVQRTQKGPSNGKIFFLDSNILEQDLRPDNTRFCMQQTWLDIGRRSFYACLCWGIHDKPIEKRLGTRLPFGIHTGTDAHDVHQKATVSLAVSFDKDNIIALGEYTPNDSPDAFE